MYPNYAKLSDAQYAAIKSLEYQDGTYTDDTGNEVPNMVDLKLIESLEFVNDEIVSINFKDRNAAIQNYEAEKTNKEFGGFKHKILIHDHVEALKWQLFYTKNVEVWNETFTEYTYKPITVSAQPFNVYNLHVLSALEDVGKAKILKRVEHDLGNDKVRVEIHVGLNDINVSAWNAMLTATYIDEDGTEQLLMTHLPNPNN